jgi:hypothetical protein
VAGRVYLGMWGRDEKEKKKGLAMNRLFFFRPRLSRGGRRGAPLARTTQYNCENRDVHCIDPIDYCSLEFGFLR